MRCIWSIRRYNGPVSDGLWRSKQLYDRRYHVTVLMGEGSTGQVWRANDTKLSRQAVVRKVREMSPVDRDRQMRVCRASHAGPKGSRR